MDAAPACYCWSRFHCLTVPACGPGLVVTHHCQSGSQLRQWRCTRACCALALLSSPGFYGGQFCVYFCRPGVWSGICPACVCHRHDAACTALAQILRSFFVVFRKLAPDQLSANIYAERPGNARPLCKMLWASAVYQQMPINSFTGHLQPCQRTAGVRQLMPCPAQGQNIEYRRRHTKRMQLAQCAKRRKG